MLKFPVIITLLTLSWGRPLTDFYMITASAMKELTICVVRQVLKWRLICFQQFLIEYLEKYNFFKIADANSVFADVKSIE